MRVSLDASHQGLLPLAIDYGLEVLKLVCIFLFHKHMTHEAPRIDVYSRHCLGNGPKAKLLTGHVMLLLDDDSCCTAQT
jgi:hypothetical protein